MLQQEMKERTKLFWLVAGFAAAFFVPWGDASLGMALQSGFVMLHDYAREHTLTCLVPAFFIAGAIAVFVSQAAVLKYFGPKAPRLLSYSVASVSGSCLAVCSCTVLPLFAGIYTRGAGIGPATAFLYSGPAINVLAIVFTARVLGWQIGLARAIGAIAFSVVVGLIMAVLFRKDETERHQGEVYLPESAETGRSLWQEGVFMLALVMVLLTATISSADADSGWLRIFLANAKWYLVVGVLAAVGLMAWRWFQKDEITAWMDSTWGFTKQIVPMLGIGVVVAGFLLGSPGGSPGIIPNSWVAWLVGGNSLWSNLGASVAGALMYFATLTEIPILQGLLQSGMGQGPALALLLAGPALSLPNMLVIATVLGWRKTLTFSGIIVVMSTIAGMIFGAIMG